MSVWSLPVWDSSRFFRFLSASKALCSARWSTQCVSYTLWWNPIQGIFLSCAFRITSILISITYVRYIADFQICISTLSNNYSLSAQKISIKTLYFVYCSSKKSHCLCRCSFAEGKCISFLSEWHESEGLDQVLQGNSPADSDCLWVDWIGRLGFGCKIHRVSDERESNQRTTALTRPPSVLKLPLFSASAHSLPPKCSCLFCIFL